MSLFQMASALVGSRKSSRQVTPAAAAPRDPVDGDAARRGAVHRIASLLGDLSRDESRALVDQVVRAFGRRVYDIPASEKHHHSDPWGLLDHSIEVAEYAVRSALGANFMDSVAPHPEAQEFRVPRLRYATFLFGLFHDVGKILGVSVQSGRRVWNPFAQELAEFVGVSTAEPPSMLWRAGRGTHAHEYSTAYLLSLFLPGGVAEYLTAPLLMELMERRSTAAMRVFDIVAKADQRSTKEDMIRREKAAEAPLQERLSYPELSVGYRELVAKAFCEGLLEELFAANTLEGDYWVGRDYVAFRYPAAVAKLAQVTRERLGPIAQKARILPTGEAGARELANQLSDLDLIFRDAQTGTWKVQMAVTLDDRFQVTAAVLFKRTLLFPGAASAGVPEFFQGGATFTRPSDNSEMAIQGFRSSSRIAVPDGAAPPAPVPPRTEAGSSPSVEPVKPASPAAAPSPVSPHPDPAVLATLRTNIVPGILLEDLRRTLLDGMIPVNSTMAPVFVCEDYTYMITPAAFTRLHEMGLYSLHPARAGTAYLDALSKLDCVLKVDDSGMVVKRIRIRENARSCAVVVFRTRGLFRSDQEIARVGYWTDSRIVEEAQSPTTDQDAGEGEDDDD